MLIANIESVARFLRCYLHIFLRIMRKKPIRYIRITPWFSFLKYVVLFDMKNLTFFNLHIRSRTESIVVDQILVERCYDTSEMRRHGEIVRRYDEIVQSGKLPFILDCGGNIGISARWFSEQFTEAKIACVEPSFKNIALANLNAPNADMIQGAVGSDAGICEISNPDANSWAFQVSIGYGSIPVLSVEDVLRRYPKEEFTPFIIKIDIEGFEEDLFSRNTEWITDFFVIIVELHDWLLPNKATSQNFLKSISQERRDFILSGENIFSIQCARQMAINR
ncbi:FkbM family methyltransferase [Mesorhizobium australicum]|uniref:Methyltransferase, FkbM family n=1 Tax=Mesorhizobium australicum TaxID=536018 RepID=A0A1X7NRD7_9HYPH|nr:FkbM family methyltransferase [Mesorhizobium australicum]SMH40751.1 methyltransferase, FkbM family [Mesorhizobium australicum]